MHRRVRKITKTKGAFTSEQALLKLMYLVIREITKKWTMARKIADKLDVSLDYLSGKTDDLLDAMTLHRVIEVQKLPGDIRDKLFYFIDMTVRDNKAKQAYAK